MKAQASKLLDFLEKSPQFIIPIYQRTYSWKNAQCSQLWDDILRTGKNDDIPAHFIGSIVYVAGGLYQVSHLAKLLIIDGQQRLTTLSLIIEALARQLDDNSEPMKGFSANKLRNYYLRNQNEEDEDVYKLLLTQTDKETLLAIVDGKPNLPTNYSIRIAENFKFFEQKVEQLKKLDSGIETLCNGLAKLMVVDISLDRNHDNPQLIFESMNSTALELNQADLIRNFILMGLNPTQQKHLYEDHWRPMEVAFGQASYDTHFDSFMRHYLTFKTGDIPNVRAVYEAFKSHARSPEVAEAGVDTLVADIHTYAGYYCAMALDKEKNDNLAAAFRDLRELKVDPAFPFLLELYSDYAQGWLTTEDFIQAVRLIEAYVFRRAVCAIATNSLNKTFTTFGRALKKDCYIESIQAHFLNLPSYRRFPSDEEFKRELSARDLYNFPRRSYCLRRLENHNRKEHVSVGEYTIEHILPQNENLSVAWREALGPEWRHVQETWLHTLGNLTLTGYNAEYSDRPFTEKRDMQGGFSESPLWLNKKLRTLDTWNEDTIQQRSKRLAEQAVQVWAPPVLGTNVLTTYSPKTEQTTGYTLDDHQHLTSDSPMRPLFDELRKVIRALDPCVSEEILKHYVAYKTETNFVDVVPHKSLLRVVLNLRFHELQDPRDIARDVTNIGHLGNGDAEVSLRNFDDLSYVMGLVRQAFEKQMDNGGEDE